MYEDGAAEHAANHTLYLRLKMICRKTALQITLHSMICHKTFLCTASGKGQRLESLLADLLMWHLKECQQQHQQQQHTQIYMYALH